LSGLSPDGASGSGALIWPSIGNLQLASGVGEFYTGLAGPSSFGTGGETPASSKSGTLVGIYGDISELLLPTGYSSGTVLSDTDTFDNATLASLGLNPGTYVWTWGGPTDPADQSFTLEIGATPLPAALPLFASGLGAIGLLAWHWKRSAPRVVCNDF
jgi:hypothetical protein